MKKWVVGSLFSFMILFSFGINTQTTHAETQKDSTYEIDTIDQLVDIQKESFDNSGKELTSTPDEQAELADKVDPDILQEATSEVIDAINSSDITGTGTFSGQSESGLNFVVETRDVKEDGTPDASELSGIQARSISAPMGVKNNVKKDFGYRRYDATLKFAWFTVIVHTHYYAGSNGLTLANFKDSSRSGMTADIELQTAPMYWKGEMSKGYEDGRAEKVGYDINAVGKWQVGFDGITAGGISIPMNKTDYFVSFIKLTKQGSNYVTVDESLKVYTSINDFNF